MKKILVIALLFVFANSKAQTGPPCWWTPTWDWLDATNTNWQYYNGASFTDMGTPFQNPNPTSALSRIIDAEDYTPAKGWVLFSKDFGCTGHPVSNQIPFFGLYNRFTGVIRYFFYNAAPSSSLINKALVTLEWQNHQKNTSLLNNTNTYNATNDQFPKTSDESLYPVNIGNYAGGGAWFIAEFTTHFDQTTGVTASGTEDLTKTGQNYKLWFKLYEVSSSSVELAGGFQFSTEVSSFAQSPSPSPVAGSPNYQLLSDAKKFLGKIPSEGDFKKIFDQFDSELNGLNTTPSVKFSIKEAYSQVLSFLNQDEFKTVLTGVAAFAGPAGQIITGAMSVIDFFADKPTQSSSPTGPTYTYMAPTVSKGSIQMEGTITTTGNAKDFTLQLPGVYHKYASGGNTEYSGLPYYDCPLGVLNLEKEPFFQKRSTIKTMGLSQTGYGGYIQSNQAVNGACSTFPLHSLTPNAQPGQNHEYTFSILREDRTSYPFDFYKVDDNVTIAVNDASGLNLEEVQFALVVELAKDASGNIVFDALKDQITYNEPPLGDYVSCFYATNSGVTFNQLYLTNQTHTEIPYDNPVCDQIKRGVYLVSEVKNGKVSKYSTPFIAASEFKGTTIKVPTGSKLMLKVLARLRPIDPQYEQTPVIITSTYDLPANTAKLETEDTPGFFPIIDPLDAPYPNTCAQEANAIDYAAVIAGTFTIPGSNGGFPPFPPTLSGSRTIETSGNITVDATTQNVIFVPSEKITLKPNTRIVASGTNTFRGYIDPSQNVSGCVSGQDASDVNHYFTSCNPDPTQRLMHNAPIKQVGDAITLSRDITVSNDELKLYCYPNPNNGNFNLVFSKTISSGSVEILTSNGIKILSKKIQNSLSNLNFEGENLEPGMYFIHYRGEGIDKNIKFIVVQ